MPINSETLIYKYWVNVQILGEYADDYELQGVKKQETMTQTQTESSKSVLRQNKDQEDE